MATLQLLFQSRERVVVRRGEIRRIGWVIKMLEAQVGQFLLVCKWPCSYTINVVRLFNWGRSRFLSVKKEQEYKVQY